MRWVYWQGLCWYTSWLAGKGCMDDGCPPRPWMPSMPLESCFRWRGVAWFRVELFQVVRSTLHTSVESTPGGTMNRFSNTGIVLTLLLWAPLLKAGSIDGFVRNADASAPMEGAQVFAYSMTAPGAPFTATADALGAYSVVVPDGSYAVIAQSAGFDPELFQELPCCANPELATPVLVNNATVGGIDFTLATSATISGRITRLDNGNALAGTVV